MSQLQQKGQIHPSSAFLLYSGPQGAGCCPPALVGGLSLTQTTGSNANLSGNTLTHTPRNYVLPVKLACNPDHHTCCNS